MPLLSRDYDERKALVRGLINALIRNGAIETTEAKADAIKGAVDTLVTKAKKADLHNSREIESALIDKESVEKLINTIAPSLKTRNSGYVKIARLGRRKGDNAMIVRVEFSDKSQAPKPVVKAKPSAPVTEKTTKSASKSVKGKSKASKK